MATAPTITAGQDGDDLTYTSVYLDSFAAEAGGPGSNWAYVDMSNGDHRAGNEGQDRDGNLTGVGTSVQGKRWSAWYDYATPDDLCYQTSGALHIGGKVVTGADPTRVNYTQNGVTYNWANEKWYTVFLSQWDRVWDNTTNTHVDDPTFPNIVFGPGHFFEMEVDFSAMQTTGFRFSWWLWPARENVSRAYNSTSSDGVEIDIFEYENYTTTDGFEPGDILLQAVLGGGVGNTPGHAVAVSGLNVGVHKVGLLWMKTKLVWYIDGVESQRDEIRVPQVDQFMIMSREINSAARETVSKVTDIQGSPPKIPYDYGLYSRSAYPDKALVATDEVLVHRVQVWSVAEATDGETTTTTPSVFPQRTSGYITPIPSVVVSKAFTLSYVHPSGQDPDLYTYAWTMSAGLAARARFLSGTTAQSVQIFIHTDVVTDTAESVQCVVTLI